MFIPWPCVPQPNLAVLICVVREACWCQQKGVMLQKNTTRKERAGTRPKWIRAAELRSRKHS